MAIQKMLNRSLQNGMPKKWWNVLFKLVKEYKDIFRVDLCEDPPSRVTPMSVSFKPGAEKKTWSSYNLKYTQEELQWLKSHIDKLQKLGYIYRNPHARMESPALVVPKPGQPKEYRLCVDVKIPNSLIENTHWPMPHLDTIKGYWMHSRIFTPS